MKESDDEYVDRINALSDSDLELLIEKDECPYEPERLKEVPLGMFHCPLCGEMVLAGVAHPRKAAEAHCDKHIVKMCLETAQILSTVNRLLGDSSETLYKVTHQSHPCVKWVLEDSKNYFWLMQLFHCLLLEYQHRYNKEHACMKIYKFLCSVENTKTVYSIC